jgi:hypothetical protein
MIQRLLKLITGVLIFSNLSAEVLVRVDNIDRNGVKELRRSIFFSMQNAGEGYIEILLDRRDLSTVEKMGYPTAVILDMDSLRRKVLSWKDAASYHSYSEMVSELLYLSETYPSLTKLDTLGYSVQGRLLLAIKISDNADYKEPEPEVRIVGTHHGNEWISTEIPLLLARYLLENYGSNPEVTYLVDNREIWIYPMHNPDGHEAVSRYNSNGVDLNRDYGYMWDGWGNSPSPYSQPETKALAEFSQKHNFVLSLSFHSYGEIVNYIYNYSPIEPPDSLLIREYSYGYASFNGYWVTEGYDWYETHGDLNDYSYGIDSDIDWTIELGNTFIPDTNQIMPIWLENRDAILYIIRKAGCGIAGFVLDQTTGDTIKEARITVLEIGWPVFTDPETGDFVRVLLPGTYTVRAEAPGYEPQTLSNVVVYEDSLTYIEFHLSPAENFSAYKLWIANIEDPNNAFQNLTFPVWSLGPPDGDYSSLGVGGEIVLRFPENNPITGVFVVTEGDDGNSGEGYSVYASNDYFGPWYFTGYGYGTDTFSLSGTGLSEAHFIKVVDDGDGNPNLSTAGFDLDAVTPLIISGVSIIFLSDSVIDESGNANGYLDPGETVYYLVELQNIGSSQAQGLEGKLQADTLLTIIDSLSYFGSVLPGSTVTNSGDPFQIYADENIVPGTQVPVQLILTADGGYVDTIEINITVGVGGDFLVYDPDPNSSSGPIIYDLLQSLDLNGDYTQDLEPYIEILPAYRSLFVTLGMYPENYVIPAGSGEGDAIANYILGGGKVYMEGGDVWYWDPSHGGYNFNNLFGINPLQDGGGDLSTISGISGTFAEGMIFIYAGENNWVDRISPLPGAFALFENLSPQYICAVAKEDTLSDTRTVGASFEFGGLVDGNPPSTRMELLERILEFFGIETGIDESTKEKILYLDKIFPNPFTNTLRVSFNLEKTQPVSLKIYDVTGRYVMTLLNRKLGKGYYQFSFYPPYKGIPSGVYFLWVKAGEETSVKKIIKISSGKR